MKVTRTSEGGPLSPVVVSQPCGCAFDVAVNAMSTCKPCEGPNDCDAAQICSYGYCEELQ